LKFVYLREKNQRREDNDNEILEVIKFDHFSIDNFLFLLSIHRVFLFELPHPTKERLAERESDNTVLEYGTVVDSMDYSGGQLTVPYTMVTDFEISCPATDFKAY